MAAPLVGQEAPALPPAEAPAVSELSESFDCLERIVLPALRSACDEPSADAAAAQLEAAMPHIRLLAHVIADDLSVDEQRVVLPMLAPRLKQLLSQLDICCSMSAEFLSNKPTALGSERFAAALSTMLDGFMGVPEGAASGHTQPEDIPLALAEADAQLAAASALLSSLERLQNRDDVEREMPTLREQLGELRSLQRGLADPQRWTKTQLFLIMQRTRERGAAVISDLGKSVALLMELDPPCHGSAELEALLTELLRKQ